MLPQVGTRQTGANIGPVNPTAAAPDGASAARQTAFQSSLQNLVGQSMQGEVLAKLTDGSSLVKVAGSSVRMMLPAEAEVGSEVAMTLVAAYPRPTFQIGDNGRPGAPAQLVYPEADGGETASATTQIGARAAAAAEADLARGDSLSGAADAAANPAQGGATAAQNARPLSPAAILLSKAPLTPSGDLPAFDPSAPAPALSDAARAIATVLTQAESRPGAPQALSGKTPLLDPARADTAQLAQTLQDTVVSSGLFYESHVAEWAQGKRALPDLQREPQMQKAMDNGDAASAARAAPAAATDLASAQLINLQLHTQEQSRVVWQGEAWPGQKMEWDIGRGGPEQGPGGKRGGAGSQEHTAWRSGVRFQFPTLGEVSASVVLIGGQVHIQMQAAAPDTAAALRAHAAALGASLDAAGSPLSSFSVGQPETTVAAGPAGQAGAAHGD